MQYCTAQGSATQKAQHSAQRSTALQRCTTLCSMAQHSAVPHSTEKHSTVQCSTLQCSTTQHNAVQQNTAQCSAVQCSGAQHKLSAVVSRTTRLRKLQSRDVSSANWRAHLDWVSVTTVYEWTVDTAAAVQTPQPVTWYTLPTHTFTVTFINTLQCESKKSPLRTCGNFSKTVGSFSTKFYTPITRSYLR